MKEDTSGATLVELIVAFALISIFAAGVTQVFSTVFHIYRDIRDLDYAMQVSDTVMDRVAGELQDAQRNDGSERAADLLTATDRVRFTDRDGTEAEISLENHLLNITSYDASGTAETVFAFDKNMYMGYEIEEIKFETPDGYPDHIIRISLSLKKTSDSYTYTTTRYISCFNFADYSG